MPNSTAARGWDLLVLLIGLGHIAIGGALLADGADGLQGAVFTTTTAIPWWGWGGWALTAGLLILLPRTRLAGLLATTLWYALWAAAITIGIVAGPGPWYAIPVYGTLAAIHVLVLLVERDRTRGAR